MIQGVTLSRGMELGHVYFMHPASCIIMVALHAQQHSSNLVHNGPCHAMFCSSFHLCASLPTSTVNSVRGIAHRGIAFMLRDLAFMMHSRTVYLQSSAVCKKQSRQQRHSWNRDMQVLWDFSHGYAGMSHI